MCVYVFMLRLVFVVCVSSSLVCFVCAVLLFSCVCFVRCWCVCVAYGVLCCCLLFQGFAVRVCVVVALVSFFWVFFLSWLEWFPCV